MPEPIAVLIVDDHPVVRDGLRGILAADAGLRVVGEAGNGRDAVTQAVALRPDVVLMDLRMPEVDGVEAIRLLADRAPEVRVLVLTTYDTDTDVLPAIEAGATGYLLKDAPREELLRAVRAAARGEAVLSPRIATRVLGQVRRPAREAVSDRELEVLQLIARGSTNREARPRSSSARRRSRPTSCTSTPSSGSATARPRSRPRSSAGCSRPAPDDQPTAASASARVKRPA